jgi:hypothetical protein
VAFAMYGESAVLTLLDEDFYSVHDAGFKPVSLYQTYNAMETANRLLRQRDCNGLYHREIPCGDVRGKVPHYYTVGYAHLR